MNKDEKLAIYAMYLGKPCLTAGVEKVNMVEGIDWIKKKVVIDRAGYDVDDVTLLLKPDGSLDAGFYTAIMNIESGFKTKKAASIAEHFKRIATVTSFCLDKGVDVFDLIGQKIAKDITPYLKKEEAKELVGNTQY